MISLGDDKLSSSGDKLCSTLLFSRVGMRVTYLVQVFGLRPNLRGLCVAGYSCCKNVHADRHCDPKDERLAVRLCTTDGLPADCVEPNTRIKEIRRANAVICPGRGV